MTVLQHSIGFLRQGVLVAAVALLAACASTPSRSGSVASAASARTAGSGDETPDPQKATADVKLVSEARSEGLPVRLSVRNGQTLYCWTDSSIGSNIPTTKCVNRADLEQMLASRRENRERMQTMGEGACSGMESGCGGGG